MLIENWSFVNFSLTPYAWPIVALSVYASHRVHAARLRERASQVDEELVGEQERDGVARPRGDRARRADEET